MIILGIITMVVIVAGILIMWAAIIGGIIGKDL